MQTYEPFLMQTKFHQCPATEIFLGGAAGPGKTRGMLEDAIDLCRNHEDWRDARFIYFRKTMDELLKVIDDSKKIISPREATYNENLHRWTFHRSGAYLRFDSLHQLSSADSHLSEEYDGIYMDECGQLDPSHHRKLRARMRTVGVDRFGDRRKPFWRGASNPGGPAHMHLLKRYVLPHDYEAELLYWWNQEQYEATGQGWSAYPAGTVGNPEPFVVYRPSHDEEFAERNRERREAGVEEAKTNTRCFIPGRLEDNPILYNDPSYEATLWELAGNDPRLYAAMRKGDWFSFEGQAFLEFERATHVIAPIIPMAHWPKWRSMDWGYTAPTRVQWHTHDLERDVIVTYREITCLRKSDAEICAAIKDAQPAYERPLGGGWRTVADPSMWANTGRDDALTRADVFRMHGIELTPANNKRAAGKARIHELLAIRPESGLPGWQVTVNCHSLIATLPTLVYDTKKPEDVDTSGDDHSYDTLRYGMMDQSSDEVVWGPGMRRSAALRSRAA